MLFDYLVAHKIAVAVTLHDSWFYTGKCMYYVEYNCDRWKYNCGKCPAKKTGNKSWFFDVSSSLRRDKEKYFTSIESLAVIGVSRWISEDASKSFLKDAKIIQCIYNWIDLEHFKPHDCSDLIESLGLSNKFIILGVSASWIPVKGINIFHELADILPSEYQIVLVGNDSMVVNKHPKIMYIGPIYDTRLLADYYSMANVFVNPTVQETLGMTTAEAMASGTPVLAYDGTATPELIGRDNKCGFLIQENCASNYIKCIQKIREEGTQVYSENARLRAELLFSKEKNINQYLNIYNMLIEE